MVRSRVDSNSSPENIFDMNIWFVYKSMSNNDKYHKNNLTKALFKMAQYYKIKPIT